MKPMVPTASERASSAMDCDDKLHTHLERAVSQAYRDGHAAGLAEALEMAAEAASWAIHDIGLPVTPGGNLELRARIAMTVIASIRALAAAPTDMPHPSPDKDRA